MAVVSSSTVGYVNGGLRQNLQGSRRAPKPKALFILEAETFELVYPISVRQQLDLLAWFPEALQTRESIAANLDILAEVELIFSGWGVPKMDARFLEAAPNLRAVFYGAGTVRHFVTKEFWARDIVVTSAAAINAVPVAEYTLGVILLSLRSFWPFSRDSRRGSGWGDHKRRVAGGFRSQVALISCGMIARRVLALLRPLDVECLVYDPFLSAEEARQLGVRRCSLDEAFRVADVVSLHTPEKPETIGMITGRHFASMKRGATFINTARPAIVRHDEMLEVLRKRPDLQVILDVCDEEPLPLSSPLLKQENVLITPHIAGSLGPECARLGEFMLEELRRYLAGEPLQGQVTREKAALLA